MRSTLLLFGAFAFGFNTATALHELGHILAAWITGAGVQAVSLHPFSTSIVDLSPDPHPYITYSAGVIFAPLASLPWAWALWRSQSAFAMPVHMTAIAALGTTGIYLVVGTAAGAGDAADLVALGVPGLVLIVPGLASIAGAVLLSVAVLPLLGFQRRDSLRKRIQILELGVLPYLALICGHHLIYQPSELAVWSAFSGLGVAVIALIAVGSHLLRRRLEPVKTAPVDEPSWAAAAFSLALGTAIVAAELLAF